MSVFKLNTPWKIRGLPRIWSLRLVAMHMVLISAFLLSFTAAANVSECEKALQAIQAKLGDSVQTENFRDVENENAVAPTVTLESSQPGLFGGRRLTLKRVGARWASSYRSVQFDPQGDPRWFIEIIGAEAAEFFGFKVLNDTQVQVPDAAEFTGALRALNGQLKAMGAEPVHITYYVTDTSENTKVSDYIRKFGGQAGLPLAPDGNHLIHDLSFHTGAIFFPEKLVQMRAYYSRYLSGFADFLTGKYASDPAKLAAAKYYSYMLRMTETVNLDTATGLVNPGIVATLRDPSTQSSLELLYTPVVFMSARGNSAVGQLEQQVDSMNPADARFANEYPFVDGSKLARAFKAIPLSQLQDDMTEYNSGPAKSVPGYEKWNEHYVPQEVEILEDLCKAIGLRRLALRDAALALLRRK